MTHRENFHQVMRRDGPERLPFELWVTEPALDLIERESGTRDPVVAFDLSFRGVSPAYPPASERWREAYAAMGVGLPADAVVGDLGHVHARPPRESVGAAYHLLEMLHPLAGAERVTDVESLPWPDVRDPALYAHLPERVAAIHAEGRAAIGQMQCTLFESAWYLRGMDTLYLDLLEGECDVSDWLLDWFTDRSVAAVEAYCDAGVDMILLGDDVATQRAMMMALPFWRRHLKPRLARVVEAIRARQRERVWIGYHSDGNTTELIDDLVEIGIDILNPIQPECMDVDAVVAAHRHHLAFYGMIGIQSTLPFGTPDDVRGAVRHLGDLAREGAALILAPSHVLEPDVPWENLYALVDAIHAERLG